MENKRIRFIGKIIILAGLLFLAGTALRAASYYGENSQNFQYTPAEKELYGLFLNYCTASQITPVALDSALSNAGRQYSAYIKKHGKLEVYDPVLEQLLYENGIYDFNFPIVISKLKKIPREKILNEKIKNYLRRESFNLVGISIVEETPERELVMIIFAKRHIQLANIPIITYATNLKISGKMTSKFFAPKLLIMAPDKKITQYELSDEDKFFEKTYTFPAQPGKYIIQIIGNDNFGTNSLALFPVFYKQQPEKLSEEYLLPDPKLVLSQAEAEGLLVKKINTARQKEGLRLLTYNPELSKSAADHALDMANNAFFSQGSPYKNETVRERLDKAGINYIKCRENIGFGRFINEVHDRFMNAPYTRSNLLEPDLTELGVGAAVIIEADGSINYFITEDFIQGPDQSTFALEKEKITSILNEKRNYKGLAPLLFEPKYAELAQKHAETMAALDSLAYIQRTDKQSLTEKYKNYTDIKKFKVEIFALPELTRLETPTALDPDYNKIVVGYTQANSRLYGDKTNWIVLVFIKD